MYCKKKHSVIVTFNVILIYNKYFAPLEKFYLTFLFWKIYNYACTKRIQN